MRLLLVECGRGLTKNRTGKMDFTSRGAAFRPWGRGYHRFDWDRRTVIINDHPWGREWVNRRAYVHPHEGPRRWEAERHDDHYELIRREGREKNAWREGREREDEKHHGEGHKPH